MNNFKFNGKYSQNGEQGIIDEILKRLTITQGVAIEFGAPTKKYCSNIYHLYEKGWPCLWLDSEPQEPGILQAFITKENVNDIIPPAVDVLSIDIDGDDWNIWNAYKGRPKIVIIEINSSLNPDVDYFTTKHGSNFSMMVKLGKSKGYELLCHTGNLIFIDKEYFHLFPDANQTFDKSWLK